MKSDYASNITAHHGLFETLLLRIDIEMLTLS